MQCDMNGRFITCRNSKVFLLTCQNFLNEVDDDSRSDLRARGRNFNGPAGDRRSTPSNAMFLSLPRLLAPNPNRALNCQTRKLQDFPKNTFTAAREKNVPNAELVLRQWRTWMELTK